MNGAANRQSEKLTARARQFVRLRAVRRRWLLLWMAVGITAPILYLAWPLLGSPVPIIVSHDTTRLSEEWLHNGQIDYYSYLAQELRDAGVTSIADDPWMKQAQPSRTIRGWSLHHWPLQKTRLRRDISAICQNIVDESQRTEEKLWQHWRQVAAYVARHPWNADRFPKLANVIKANSDWFAEAQSSFVPYSPVDLKPRDPDEVPFSTSNLGSRARYVNEAFSTRFLIRAAYRWGSGEHDAAFEDILFALKIANRDQFERGGAGWVAPFEADVLRLVMNCFLESPPPAEELEKFVLTLPLSSTKQQFSQDLERERFYSLDGWQSLRNRSRDNWWFFVDRNHRLASLLNRRIRINTDWNEVMRVHNRHIDQMQDIVRKNSLAEALAAARLLEPGRNAGDALAKELRKRELWHRVPSTEEIIEALGYFRQYQIWDLATTIQRDQRRRVVPLIAALAQWKQQHGMFPSTLDALVGSPGVSVELLTDLFSDKRLMYRATSDGFELRSVGGNQTRDDIVFSDLDCEPRKLAHSNRDLVWTFPSNSVASGDN